MVRLGQPVAGTLDQRQLDIGACQALCDAGRRLPWHLFILHAVKEMDRTVDVQPAAKAQIVPPVGDQVPRIFHWLVRIGVRQRNHAVSLDPGALLVGEFGPEKILGEVRRRRDADQPGNAFRTRQRDIQHQPAAE